MATVKKKKKVSLGSPVSCCADDAWEVREDFRTLCRAKEIEGDSKRFAKVQEFAVNSSCYSATN